MTPLEFLKLLWGLKSEDLYILLWTRQDKRSQWFRDIAAAAEFVLKTRGKDIYVGVGLSRVDHGPVHRCKSEEVAGIPGFWADFDLLSPAHDKKALPTTITDALSIVPESMPPTIVIATGNGGHAWWLFEEPYIFDDEDDRKATVRQVERWHTLLRSNASSRGWAYERLSDLARALRIPGTQNLKDTANPKDVVVHSFTNRRYKLTDFEQYLDAAAIPDQQAQGKVAQGWAEQLADKPYLINANGRIPQETLDRWMAANMRFKNTWQRQRHDMKDQSQSGYDLALANFGTEIGLSDQQIVDLITHHRSLYAQKARTRVDYFQRTLAAASRQSPKAGALAALFGTQDAATSGNGAPGASEAADAGAILDPAVIKASLCEKISTVLRVRIVRIVKLTGKEPTFHMELEEGKVEFPKVADLITQKSMRLALAATTGKLMPTFKGKEWEQLAQAMLDACIVEDGGDENDWEGSTRIYIATYLAEVGFIESLEGQSGQNLRKPIVYEGKIAISSIDLQIQINKSTLQNLSVKAVASMLRAIGAKSRRVRGAKFKEQSRWLLPVDQFDPAEYSPPTEGTNGE